MAAVKFESTIPKLSFLPFLTFGWFVNLATSESKVSFISVGADLPLKYSFTLNTYPPDLELLGIL
jgi:hypothetical protein